MTAPIVCRDETALQSAINDRAATYTGRQIVGKPTLVEIYYQQKDGTDFADVLLLMGIRVKEGWDYTDGRLADETMSAAHPDFQFKDWTVGKFVRETVNHPKHPGVFEVKIIWPDGTKWDFIPEWT